MNLAGKTLAFVLIAVGVALIVTAGLLVWSSVQLRFGTLALYDAIDKSTAGDARGARSAGEDAVGWLGEHPAAVLAAVDLGSSSAVERLQRAAVGATSDQRAALAAAAALAKGAAVDGMDLGGSDAALINAIAAKDPASYQLSSDSPPHRAVLGTWAVSRLRAAWAAGRTDDVAAAAAIVLAVAPRHPQAKELELVLVAIDTGTTKDKLIAAASRIEDPKRRAELGTSLMALVPGRTDLQMLIPNATAMSATEAALKQRMDAAIGSGSITDTLIAQCLQMGKTEWAEILAAKTAGDAKTRATALVQALDAGGAGFSPATTRITAPVISPANLTFHLTTVDGGIPSGEIGVTLGDDAVPSTMLGRYGTLISVPLKKHGSMPVAITYRGTAVWNGTLTL